MTASRISPLDSWANGSHAVGAAILPESVLCPSFHQARSHGGWPSLRLGQLVGEADGTRIEGLRAHQLQIERQRQVFEEGHSDFMGVILFSQVGR